MRLTKRIVCDHGTGPSSRIQIQIAGQHTGFFQGNKENNTPGENDGYLTRVKMRASSTRQLMAHGLRRAHGWLANGDY